MALVRRRANETLDDDFWEANELIAQLTLDDINTFENGRKRKGKEGAPLTDEELAFQLYAEEAHAMLTCTQDHSTAESLARALDADLRLVRMLEDAETVAREDREVALALSEGREPPSRTSLSTPSVISTPTLITASTSTSVSASPIVTYRRHAQIPNDGPSGVRIEPITLSRESLVPKPSTSARVTKAVECTICGDRIQGVVVKAPCGTCSYDMTCLRELYTRATTDESLFPPRCCQKPFKLEDVKAYLGSRLVGEFEKKSIEFNTLNRVYCHQPTCSKFLCAATTTVRLVRCPDCLSVTCLACKQKSHHPLPCTTTQDAEVIALGNRQGWKRCPSCYQLIELAHGCYHMTCRCRHQFCYLCAETWKTCQCAQWDENRLIEAAEVRVNRGLDQARPVPAAPALRLMVQREAARLREDHECMHYSWYKRNGGGSCESCGHWLRDYLLQCHGCRMLSCVRCRRNRL